MTKDYTKLIDNEYNGIDSLKLLEMILKTTDIVEEVFNRFYKKFKLSKIQFSALYIIYLYGEEGIQLSTIGKKLFVTKSNITSLADRMENRGLIRRISDRTDRRSVKAVVTSEGEKILENVLPSSKIFSEKILNFLTETEKKRFYELMVKIQKELVEDYIVK